MATDEFENQEFIPLDEGLVESAVRLSAQAGWNQTAADWRRLDRLRPGDVRVLVDDSGEVRASWSVAGLGPGVAWIGMILVDERLRGRGLGTRAFSAALDQARAAGHGVLGLDATTLGEPIYRRFGFETIRPIVRWQGTVRPPGSRAGVAAVRRGLHDGVLRLDARCAAADRGRLLALLAADGTILSIEASRGTRGYAAIRPGRTAACIGPVVAESDADFETLMAAAAVELAGRPAICDLLDDGGDAILRGLGMEPARRLARMTMPRLDDCLCGRGVRCGAGFELG